MAAAERRDRPAEAVAGYMAAAALFVSLIGLVYRPVRVVPVAIVVALIAAAIGGRHHRLAVLALGVGAVAWLVGMTIAVATNRALY